MSEHPPPPLIGPHAPQNARPRGDNPYNFNQRGGPVLRGRVGKPRRAAGALQNITLQPPGGRASVPIGGVLEPDSTAAIAKSEAEKKSVRAAKIAIDQLVKSNREELLAIDTEKAIIAELKRNNPNDPQIEVVQAKLKKLKRANNNLRTRLGQQRSLYKKNLAALPSQPTKAETKAQKKQKKALEKQARLEKRAERKASRRANKVRASLEDGFQGLQMGTQNRPISIVDWREAAAQSTLANSHMGYMAQQNQLGLFTDLSESEQSMQMHSSIPIETGKANQPKMYGKQMYTPALAQFSNGYIQAQARNMAADSYIQENLGNENIVSMQQPTQYMAAPVILDVRSFRNLTDARNALQDAQAQTNTQVEWVQHTIPKVMPQHVYLGTNAVLYPVGRRWESGEQAAWKQQQLIEKKALQQHKEDSQQQKENALTSAQLGSGYVQGPPLNQATFQTTIFGQAIKNQQIPIQTPIHHNSFQPINAPASNEQFVLPSNIVSKLDAWQQQQKHHFLARQQQEDADAQYQGPDARSQVQQTGNHSFQVYGKTFTKAIDRENKQEKAAAEEARPTMTVASFQESKRDLPEMRDLDMNPGRLPASCDLGPYRETLQEIEARRAQLRKILFTPLNSVRIIDLTDDGPENVKKGASDLAENLTIDLTGDGPDDANMAVSGIAKASTAKVEKQIDAKMGASDIAGVSGAQAEEPMDTMMDANNSLEASTTQVAEEAFGIVDVNATVAENNPISHDAYVPKPAESMIAVEEESFAPVQPEHQSDSAMGGCDLLDESDL